MSNKPLGRFFAISAPSGAGKTTLVDRLLKEFPGIRRSVSCTTRKPRLGEKDGVDYFFIDKKKFEDMVRKDLFFEWEEVHGACYGTPKEPLLKRRNQGQHTILDVDTRGGLTIKKAFSGSCIIFLLPPSLKDLEARLRGRKTDSEEAIQRRLEDARTQIAEKDKFDYVVVNDDLDRAYNEIRKIIYDSIGGHP